MEIILYFLAGFIFVVLAIIIGIACGALIVFSWLDHEEKLEYIKNIGKHHNN